MEIKINEHFSIVVDIDADGTISAAEFMATMDLVTRMLKVAERQTDVVGSIRGAKTNRKPYNGGMPRKDSNGASRIPGSVSDEMMETLAKKRMTKNELAEATGKTKSQINSALTYQKSKGSIKRFKNGTWGVV